jgi:D-3-phosphoglycerate dehydrogenase
MLNQSRGEISYTLVDLDSSASADTLQRIAAISGILSVRVLPIIEK